MAVKSARTMKDKELVQRAMADYNQAYSAKIDSHTRNERYLRIYKALDPVETKVREGEQLIEKDSGRFSNTYMPIGAAVVDSAQALLYNALFSNPDYLTISAREWQDEPFEEVIRAFLIDQHRQMGFRKKILEAIQTALCFDYCVTGARWLLRSGYKNVRVQSVKSLNYGGVALKYQSTKMEPRWFPDAVDRPDMMVFDYFRCFHDESATDFEDSAYFCDTRDVLDIDLQDLAVSRDNPWGRYKNVDKVLKKYAMSQGNQTIDWITTVDQGTRTSLMPHGRKMPVLRYWTPDHVCDICMEEVIWRMDLCGWPLQKWTIYDIPKKFNGMGILQRIERQQYDVNASMNARRNLQNLISNPFAVVDQDLVAQQEGKPQLTPGLVLVSSNTRTPAKDKIWIYTPGQNTLQDAMGDLAVQVDMIQKVTHTSENTLGSYASGRRSATEARNVAAGQGVSQFEVASKIEHNNLVPFYEEQFKLDQVLMTDEQTFKVFGNRGWEWIAVKPENLHWKEMPAFTCGGVEYAAKHEVEKQQFLLLLKLAFAAPQIADLPAMFAKAGQLLDPKDYRNFIRDPRNKAHNVPPNFEHLALAQGFEAEVSQENNHPEHIAEHEAFMRHGDFKLWPLVYQERLLAHIQIHKQATSQQSAGQVSTGMQDGSDMARGQGPAGAPQQPDMMAALGGLGGPE